MWRQALQLLRQALGDDTAIFRKGQVVSALVQRSARLLAVRRTGWGKNGRAWKHLCAGI
jgi:superfamily II DNA helicase RecQ